MTTRSPEELAAMTPEEREAWKLGEIQAVYGAGAKRGRDGKFQEQGIGAPGNESVNHFLALEKAEGKAAADAARARANKRAGGVDRW
jgi:hypothetical protein